MGTRKNSKDSTLLRDLIKDTLPLIEKDEEEENKALAQGGFELVTSRYDAIALTTSPRPLPGVSC